MVGDSGSEEDKESHSPNCILGAGTDCREKMSELRNTVSEIERHLKRSLNHLYSAPVKAARKHENDGNTR